MSLLDLIPYIIALLLNWLAAQLSLAYVLDAREVAEENIDRAAIIRRRTPALTQQMLHTEQRLAALDTPAAQPAEADIQEARDHLYAARADLALIEQDEVSFLPRYSSNHHAFKSFLLRPDSAIRLSIVYYRLVRQKNALARVESAVNAAGLIADRREGVPQRLERDWRDKLRRWQSLMPQIQEEYHHLPDCVHDYRTRALGLRKALERVQSHLGQKRPVEDALYEEIDLLEEGLHALEYDFGSFLNQHGNYRRRLNTLQDALAERELIRDPTRATPPLLQDAIHIMLEQARTRTEECDFQDAIDWLSIAEGWLELVPGLLEGLQGVQKLLDARNRTLSPNQVESLLSQWEVLSETVNDRWMDLAEGMVRDPAQADFQPIADDLENWLSDLSMFRQQFAAERLRTREHADSAIRQYAQTMVWIRDNGGLDSTIRQSVEEMRRAWARAADNPRRLAELADEAARESRIFGRRHALDQSRYRKFRQIMSDVRPLFETARENAREWTCLRQETAALMSVASQIGEIYLDIKANGDDSRHQKLEQMVKLGEQARTLGRELAATGRELALQKKRIRRKMAHVEEHFLRLNPTHVRSQLDYVSDQVTFAQEMSEVELAREELRRTLDLIDDIVIHFGGGWESTTGR